MDGKTTVERFLKKDPGNLYLKALKDQFEKGARSGELTIEEAQAINLELSRLEKRGLASKDEFIVPSGLSQQRALYDLASEESWQKKGAARLASFISNLKNKTDDTSILQSASANRLLNAINDGTITQEKAEVAINKLFSSPA